MPRRADDIVFMFFTTGKSAQGVPKEELTRLQAAHIANLGRLYHAGISPLAGPLADPERQKRGIVLLRLKEPAAVPEHFRPDPYVSQGFMKVEAHRMTPLVLDLDKPSETEIAEHTIALIEEADAGGKTAPPPPLDIERWERLPWRERPRVLLRRADPKDGPLFAVAIFASAKQDEVRALLQKDPALRPGGPWRLHIWKQWLGRNALKP